MNEREKREGEERYIINSKYSPKLQKQQGKIKTSIHSMLDYMENVE